ncbi:MAG TPA: 4-(cytidine 5'-diphospho)-2-C-methyl-D-erythritol kinase [Vicinamibacterales bacterium]|nr:4-(cytidine 5'-diphospho)-2-C-methyl-D-erythritol kinase [Vicinamibacterales bacterium]
MRSISLASFAKINLDLRILGTRPDGYHDLKTVFQSLALFDNVTVTARRGPLAVTCDEPDIPTDQRNLVWKAASLLHRVATGKQSAPSGIAIDLRKRVPSEAGLGGGSSNAAMTLLALNKLWKLDLDLASLTRIGARLGADVPYFLVGGTAPGLGRGDDIYPLADMPPVHVVILRPGFGVATSDAYTWFDEELRRAKEPAPRVVPPGWPAWSTTLRNDLEIPVVRHHPAIGRIKQSLVDAGAAFAAMSGSGSAVFGLFERADAARRTANDLARPGWLSLLTRTLNRHEYARRVAAGL